MHVQLENVEDGSQHQSDIIICFRYSTVQFVSKSKLCAADLPLAPVQFERLIRDQCNTARSILETK